MDELSNIVMIDICAKTKQVLLREITNEKFENLSTLRHELLLLLLESTEFKDSHTLSKTKIKYEWLLVAYQTKYNMKFEQKNFALSSNGYNFPLIVRRSIREFVEHDEQDGFYLSRLFSETHRLWLILIETNKRMAKSTQTKGENIHMQYLEHEFERNFAHQNKYSLGAL